jgi:hypothetical protein
MNLKQLKQFLKNQKGYDGLVSKTLMVIGIIIALYVLGSLGTGTGSFWYALSNPNTTGASPAVQVLVGTVLPIIAAVAVILVLLPRKK